ncbi:formyl-CoA transferase [Jatrophihabitans endophyticus]|uniref:Formyl-CoA transferase n=1 Tax=Jatrophihabitans endophyticus TaxID=1206085 RepID=A0A1M5RW67_9ACTN|nr:CoA transferase [Jatrophihabitans endophyticus]SHH30411.1 formyl-CoA transferase [Jatrophihabitans endophyticus]
MTSAPLDGVLVADFSRVLAGPLATMTLADLGATVVKVERPDAGDETRSWGPPWAATGSASYYESVNRSKYGVALDLADPDDRRRAVELARRADVVVENHRPGSLARFGLDYDAVAATNPRVVYCSISGFGDAAGAARPGYDFLVQAVGGLMSITGPAAGEPTKVGVALVDVLAGKDVVVGVLAALAARERDGHGQHLRVELLTSLLGGLANQAAGYLTTGRSPGRLGNAHPSIAPYETLRCADAPIAVACGNDAQFARLCVAVGRPELVADERFRSNGERVGHRAALIAELEAALSVDTAARWEARLTAAQVPAGLVGSVGDAIERADLLGLDPLLDVGAGHAPAVRHPVRYSRSATAPVTPPPRLGEHDGTVRGWLDGSGTGPLPRRG